MEVAGPAGSGKSQLCMSLAMATAAAGRQVFYLDGGDASASRMAEIATARGWDPVAVLRRVTCQPVFSGDDLLQVLQSPPWDRERFVAGETGGQLPEQAAEMWPRLVVIDSLGVLLGPLIGGGHTQGHALMSYAVAAMRQLSQRGVTLVVRPGHSLKTRILLQQTVLAVLAAVVVTRRHRCVMLTSDNNNAGDKLTHCRQ